MSCVLPGAADVFASFVLLQSILINDDLPTLLLPINAYSGLSALGHLSTDGLEMRYVAFVICMLPAKKTKFVRWNDNTNNAPVLKQQTGALCISQRISSITQWCKETGRSAQTL